MKKENKIQIKCYISENEHEQIKFNAKVCDKVVSAYVREKASNFCVLMYDWKAVDQHNCALSSLRNEINFLFWFIRKKEHYVPVDLEFILRTTNELVSSEKNIFNILLNDCYKKNKTIEKETRKIVNRRLEKTQEQKRESPKAEKRKYQLKVYAKETEYLRIKNNARVCGQTISTYIREAALRFTIINVNYDEIVEQTEEIMEKQEIIYRLIYTIIKTGEYVPADLERILEIINDIYHSQKKLIQRLPAIRDEKSRQVAIEARKIVREKILK